MKVVVWKLNDEHWVAYTEDANVAKEAVERYGLRLMGTYFKRGKGLEPFAWQYTGSKEAVLALAELNNKISAANVN